MDPAVLAFGLVVLAAFAFGVVTAPLGLLLGLPPGPVALGVFLGSAAFMLVSVPVVLDRMLVPAAGIALDAPRTELYRWAVLGCGTWAVLGTLGTDLLVHLVHGG